MTSEGNKRLVERYPFLLPRNRWTDKVPDDYDYSYTELDAMPDGWRKAFGEQMCEEIREELIRVDALDTYRILQIKEKYGSLRWCDSGNTEKILREIVPKYEDISRFTCAMCGKPTMKVLRDRILPCCDVCIKKVSDYEHFTPYGEPL